MLGLRKRIATNFWLGFALVHCVGGLPELIRIGGLFGDDEDPTIEAAFKYAIHRINQDRTILPRTKIGFDIQHLPASNSFLASKKACNQAGLGIAAIFGPQNPDIAGHINSMCNTLEIPHIEVRLEPERDPEQPTLFSMNVFPERTQLSRAFLELLKLFQWNKFCVIYGDQKDLLLLQDIIRAPINRDVEITVRQVNAVNMRETLKEVEKKGIRRIIAHLNIDNTYLMLKAALQLGMIDPSHHFILTNLDLETINMEDFRHNYVNLTGFRLVRYEEPAVQDAVKQMRNYERFSRNQLLNTSTLIKTQSALMYDAIHVLVQGLTMLDRSTRLRLVNLTCDGDQAWAFGSSLYNYLNLVDVNGLTGRIRFDKGGRTHFSLDILQLQSTGLKKVGHWGTTDGINFTAPFEVAKTGGMFGNKTLIVTSILLGPDGKEIRSSEAPVKKQTEEAPYVMAKKSEQALVGNERFEGFCVDLLAEIAEEVNFQYEIRLVPDGKYGAPDPQTKIWNGMVKQLLDRKADLAVASLTINYLREQVIDFTKPFMNLGISILFQRPRSESPGLFSFLNPLAIEIWVYVIAAYFVVSILMFVLARFSPYEWYNPHPCNPETDEVENIFTLSNSFWFAVGTLMQQGSDINPRAVSTRIVGGMWWFFTLIIISSYTANLAAFLTVERMVSPIESAEDLAKQTKIKYGTIAGGSTMTFFRESQIPTYQRMWSFMESQEPGVFVQKTEEGIERVLKGDYAFLMESTMIDYTIQRQCDLMQVGGLLDSKGYGIGTQRDSPYRDPISMAILNLQESGRIQMLYNKWWKNTGTCSNDEKKQESKASSLGLANVGGIFVVLVTGLILAVISSVVEFIWNAKKNAVPDKYSCSGGHHIRQQSLWSEMLEELRFAIRCHGSTKRPALKRKCSKCAHNSSSDPCVVDSPNGIIQLRDVKKSPIPSAAPSQYRDQYRDHREHQGRFRYSEPPQSDPYHVEYRDTPT